MQIQNSDKGLDRVIKALVRDSSADDTTLSAIADSPAIWWNVQRQIRTEKESVVSPWPPSLSIRSWLAIGVSGLAVALLLGLLFIPSSELPAERAVRVAGTGTSAPAELLLESNKFAAEPEPVNSPEQPRVARSNRRKHTYSAKAQNSEVKGMTEIKSDYISLSYSGVPESGQVLRVKVPRSMMVSLGLVSSVDKPAGLVDADVVVGDDGQTHAIRFIRY